MWHIEVTLSQHNYSKSETKGSPTNGEGKTYILLKLSVLSEKSVTSYASASSGRKHICMQSAIRMPEPHNQIYHTIQFNNDLLWFWNSFISIVNKPCDVTCEAFSINLSLPPRLTEQCNKARLHFTHQNQFSWWKTQERREHMLQTCPIKISFAAAVRHKRSVNILACAGRPVLCYV